MKEIITAGASSAAVNQIPIGPYMVHPNVLAFSTLGD